MKLTPVESIPGKKANRETIPAILEEFSKMKTKIVELDWKDAGYRTVHSPTSSFSHAIRRHGYSMRYVTRGDHAFLVKVDPDER